MWLLIWLELHFPVCNLFSVCLLSFLHFWDRLGHGALCWSAVADSHILVYTWVSPTCGLESHSQRTTGWFPGLITPVGSAKGAPSLTGPFWKHTGWCLNGWTRTGGGWNCNLFLSFSLFSVFSVPPPFTSPLVLYPHSHPFNPEYFLFVSLSFCHWGLSVQLFLQVSADILGMVEHLCLEIQIQSSLSETPALGYFPVCFPTLSHPLGCSPPGSSVCGVFQARILVWVAFSFFRRSSQPIDWTPVSYVSCTAGRFFTHWANLVGV